MSSSRESQSAPPPGKRAPQARRDAIVAAAAQLLVEPGGPTFTHRAVAARAGVSLGSTTRYFASIDQLRADALALLSQELEAGLEQMQAALESSAEQGVGPAVELMYTYLADPRQARATLAIMAAAASQPDLASLALGWSTQLTAMLAAHVGELAARAVVIFVDGAAAHAALRGAPLSQAELARVIDAIVRECA